MSDYKVRIVSQEDVSAILYLSASDFIESDEDTDLVTWNNSFNIGGPTC